MYHPAREAHHYHNFKKLYFDFRPLLGKVHGEEKENVMFLISDIKEEGPFTALGFFNIECSTLTSLVSTILTYLIVLVQFQPTAPCDYSEPSRST